MEKHLGVAANAGELSQLFLCIEHKISNLGEYFLRKYITSKNKGQKSPTQHTLFRKWVKVKRDQGIMQATGDLCRLGYYADHSGRTSHWYNFFENRSSSF